ncbi:hypothetical protein V8C86DRAFT_2593919 [Haematococcus lacustris]
MIAGPRSAALGTKPEGPGSSTSSLGPPSAPPLLPPTGPEEGAAASSTATAGWVQSRCSSTEASSVTGVGSGGGEEWTALAGRVEAGGSPGLEEGGLAAAAAANAARTAWGTRAMVPRNVAAPGGSWAGARSMVVWKLQPWGPLHRPCCVASCMAPGAEAPASSPAPVMVLAFTSSCCGDLPTTTTFSPAASLPGLGAVPSAAPPFASPLSSPPPSNLYVGAAAASGGAPLTDAGVKAKDTASGSRASISKATSRLAALKAASPTGEEPSAVKTALRPATSWLCTCSIWLTAWACCCRAAAAAAGAPGLLPARGLRGGRGMARRAATVALPLLTRAGSRAKKPLGASSWRTAMSGRGVRGSRAVSSEGVAAIPALPATMTGRLCRGPPPAPSRSSGSVSSSAISTSCPAASRTAFTTSAGAGVGAEVEAAVEAGAGVVGFGSSV